MQNKKHILAVIAVVSAIALVTSISASLLGSRQLSADVINSGGECGGFYDIQPGTPMCGVTQRVKELGIFGGDGNGNFRPDNPISRAEAVKVLAEALYPGQATANNSPLAYSDFHFQDLPRTSNVWYFPYLKLMVEKNLVAEGFDRRFRPLDYVNAAEFTKMLYSQIDDLQERVEKILTEKFGNSEGDKNFTFRFGPLGLSPYEWYANYMVYLLSTNEKNTRGEFLPKECGQRACPGKNMTRFEAAAAILAFLEDASQANGITDEITEENCTKINKLQNMTGSVQQVNVNEEVRQECLQKFPTI